MRLALHCLPSGKLVFSETCAQGSLANSTCNPVAAFSSNKNVSGAVACKVKAYESSRCCRTMSQIPLHEGHVPSPSTTSLYWTQSSSSSLAEITGVFDIQLQTAEEELYVITQCVIAVTWHGSPAAHTRQICCCPVTFRTKNCVGVDSRALLSAQRSPLEVL